MPDAEQEYEDLTENMEVVILIDDGAYYKPT